ncbi:tetratricopeptide repeat protein [candidate division CSSED10-310 bacterium]|uniref:Tetratricopeptide repeat protein n=1 Tax=candidate division CSSED10-310 bacterium TaxID=2855610 RepID=A0ABV6Z3A9_UNCC1
MHPKTIGSYHIIKPLGQGGMGVVYQAQHCETGDMVALKTIKMVDKVLLDGIRREIRALARIKHPGIVRIVAEGVLEGLPWYAMELLSGSSLRDHVLTLKSSRSTSDTTSDETRDTMTGNIWWTQSAQISEKVSDTLVFDRHAAKPGISAKRSAPAPGRRTIPIPEILTLIRRLCAPLAFLHGEGIVHRDLKPDNIIITNGEMPTLVDFGLMVQFSGEESRDTLLMEYGTGGTVSYMSPEQIRGEFVDARADLYALGCILYELLVGHPPFVSPRVHHILHAHLNVSPVPPSKFRKEISTELDTLVLRLLAKNQHDRLGHADVVASALSQLGAEGSTRPGPKPRTYLYRSRFAGRDSALEQLMASSQRLPDNQGSLVLVGGESGVGKTRLIIEFGREVAQQVLVLTGVCFEGKGGALRALQRPLQAIADRCREQGRAETDRILGQRGKVLAVYEPSLSSLPGQEFYPEPEDLPLRAATLRLFRSLAETFRELSTDQPLLIFLDDLQWADELTFSFLHFLLRTQEFQHQALLIVGTYRSEEVAGSLQKILDVAGVEKIILARLHGAAVKNIVGDMLALSPAPPLFCSHLNRHSEGNPLFVAEYLKIAVEEGLLFRDELGRWHVAGDDHEQATEENYAALPLPVSLSGLLNKRLAGLSRVSRQMINAATVIGREIDLLLLGEMIGTDEEQLQDLVAQLLHRQILEQTDSGGVRFSHAKIRETALAQLTAAQSRTLHLKAAQGMEKVYPARREEFMAELGWHWQEAGQADQARPCFLAAARRSQRQYDQQETQRLFQAYLDLVETPDWQSIGARNVLSNVFQSQGRFQEALAELEVALAEARAIQHSRAEGRTLICIAIIHQTQGRSEQALELYQQALKILQKLDDHNSVGSTLNSLAVLHHEQGQYDQALDLYEQALTCNRKAGNRNAEAVTLKNIGLIKQLKGQFTEALALYQQALAVYRQQGDRTKEGWTLQCIAMLHQDQGRLDQALDLLQQVLTISREVGERRFEGWTLCFMASLYEDMGLPDQALTLGRQALNISRELGDPRLEGSNLIDLARLERQAGFDLNQSKNKVTQAITILNKVHDLPYLAYAYFEQAFSALACAESPQTALEKAMAVGSQLPHTADTKIGQMMTRFERAQTAFDQGHHHLLFQGELIADLTPGLRQWLVDKGHLQSQQAQLDQAGPDQNIEKDKSEYTSD